MEDKLLLKKLNINRPLVLQFLKYVVVGGLAALINFGLLLLFTEVFGIYYLISTTLSNFLALLFNFFVANIFVFNGSVIKNKFIEMVCVFAIGLFGVALNSLLMFIFTDGFKIEYYFSQIICTGLVLIWNFAGRKLFIYKK